MEKALRKTLKDGNFRDVPPVRSKIMSAIRGRGNKTTETRFRVGLVGSGIRGWKLHQKIGRTRPDFFFPEENLAVYIDGCFWHGCPRCGHGTKTNKAYWDKKIQLNKQRDRRNKRELEVSGIKVVRFWEHQIQDNVGRCVKKVRRLSTTSGQLIITQ
ncbi:MAG: very short patch repair endonuclease [bacterium]|nr:very short patch repair endonuclease [bacterium]